MEQIFVKQKAALVERSVLKGFKSLHSSGGSFCKASKMCSRRVEHFEGLQKRALIEWNFTAARERTKRNKTHVPFIFLKTRIHSLRNAYFCTEKFRKEIEKTMNAKAIYSYLKGEPKVSEGTTYTILFAISFAHLLNDMIQSVIPSIYPIIKEKFGFSFVQIGLITLVFQLTSSLLQPLTGLSADRHPRPYSLAIGMCFTLIGLCLLAYAGNFHLILLAVSLIGCGSSVFHPGASRVAQLASGGRKSLAQSIFQVGGNGGNAFGPLVAALIVLPYGQAAIGWFALAALLAILVLTRIGNWYRMMLVYRIKHAKTATALSGKLSPHKVHTAMAILILLVFSKYFYIAAMTNYFTFFLIERFGVSVQQSQFCLFAFLAALAAGTLIGGVLGDKFGRKYVILGSIFGAAPFALLMPYTNLGWTLVLAVIVGFVIASAFSAILVYATDLMPDKVGMIAGIFFGLMFGLGGLGSAFFGWLADRTSIEFIFQISTLLPLMGIIACFLPNIKTNRQEQS